MHQRFSAKCIAGLQRLRRRPRGAARRAASRRPATATSARTRPRGSGGSSGIGGRQRQARRRHRSPDADHPQDTATIAVRKVKNLLTGMPPTDEDVALVTTSGAAGLQHARVAPGRRAIRTRACSRTRWSASSAMPSSRRASRRRRTSRSSSCRTAASTSVRAARAWPATTRSRAWCRTFRTASRRPPGSWCRRASPFTETLTTNQFVMTTALKSLYIQIEMPRGRAVQQRQRGARLEARLQRQPDSDRAGDLDADVQRRGARLPATAPASSPTAAAAPRSRQRRLHGVRR